MIASQNVLDALKQIGLNLYERKLWVALLSRGTSTAGELSSMAKVPRSRSYDVLESLAEKGFVIVQTAKPLKYVAIQPKEALERAKKKIVQDADIMTKRIDQIKASPILKELEKIHKKGVDLVEPEEFTGSLKGRHLVNQQLETIFKSAKQKIYIMATQQTLQDIHSNHSDILKKASEKGVKIKIAAHGNVAPDVLKGLKSFAEVRRAKGGPVGRFAIVDGKHAVLALTQEDVHPSQDSAFWTQSEHVAGDVLEPMFNHLWEHMEAA